MTIAEYLEQKGWTRGVEEGQQKGRSEEARRIAHAMLDEGFNVQQASKLTGVAETELVSASTH